VIQIPALPTPKIVEYGYSFSVIEQPFREMTPDESTTTGHDRVFLRIHY
jgi:hypothetical protein